MGTDHRTPTWKVLTGAAVVVFVLGAPLAVRSAGPERSAPRVRGLTADAAQLLAAARTRSATATRLLDQLEASDLIVLVTTVGRLPKRNGDLMLLSARGPTRYVRVRVSLDQPTAEHVIALLAHELQHAVEVAGAPDVRNDVGMACLYQRIGVESHTDHFETDRACEVQKVALREARRTRSSRPIANPSVVCQNPR